LASVFSSTGQDFLAVLMSDRNASSAQAPSRVRASIATATETFSQHSARRCPQGRCFYEYLHNLKRTFVAGCNYVIWMSNHFEGRGDRGKREFYFFYRMFRGNCMLCDKMNIVQMVLEKKIAL
jgi:hypothetical protein